METLMPSTLPHHGSHHHHHHQQTSLDSFLGQTGVCSDLPVLGGLALEQILLSDSSQQTQRVSVPKVSSDMERMSPDSSMDWATRQRMESECRAVPSSSSGISSSTSSPVAAASQQQPDSTTSDPAYDSDAFNSDDSNESFVELQLNPNLLANLTAQQQQQQQHQHQGQMLDDSSSSRSTPPRVLPSAEHNFSGRLPPSSPSCSANGSDKKKKTKKKTKRAGDVVLKCELCAYSTRFKEHLTSHMNTHREDRNHMCSDCGQTFKWSHSLRRHQRKHRQDFKYACSTCYKAFSRKDHLTIHEALHRAPPPGQDFKCEECGAAFKNKKTLAGHVKTHSATRRAHKCPQCDSEFTRRASLNRHVKATHAGEVIRCPLCPATFSYKSTLEDHKKAAHNHGRRDFECELCGVQFAVKAYLSKHTVTCRNRTLGRSFPCTLCAKNFPTRRHLSEHSKRKHPNVTIAGALLTPPSEEDSSSVSSPKSAAMASPSPMSSPMFSPPPPTPASQHPPPPYHHHHHHNQPLPAFQQYAGPQQQQQSQQQYQTLRSPLPCELCHATFSDDVSLEAHLMGHFPPTPPPAVAATQHTPTATPSACHHAGVTGNDLPLPQLQEEENVGSLLRLVYNCSDQQGAQAAQVAPASAQEFAHQDYHKSGGNVVVVPNQAATAVGQSCAASAAQQDSFMDYPFESFLN